MALQRFGAIAAMAALPLVCMAQPAVAQNSPLGRGEPLVFLPAPPPHARPRIEIYPRPPLYRRCADWYELQYRPSGTVLYPQMRCRWVRG